MNKLLVYALLFLLPLLLCSQNLEVEGKTKIAVMDLDNAADTVVVRLPDGTLAVRAVSTLSEFQVLSRIKDTIFLSDGGFVLIPKQNLSEVLSVSNSAGDQFVSDVLDPVLAQDAATKAYVDELKAELLKLRLQVAGLIPFPALMDIDGNAYDTVHIGTQIWMKENLRTTKYNDGTPIPLVAENGYWSLLSSPGYCFYDTTGSDYTAYSQETYGALYNYFAVADTNSRNVCPIGWHVPSESEFETLYDFLGGQTMAGGKMKTTGTLHWESPNTGASNESGFAAYPASTRSTSGAFTGIGRSAHWWSSTEVNYVAGKYLFLGFTHPFAHWSLGGWKNIGTSVRCVMD